MLPADLNCTSGQHTKALLFSRTQSYVRQLLGTRLRTLICSLSPEPAPPRRTRARPDSFKAPRTLPCSGELCACPAQPGPLAASCGRYVVYRAYPTEGRAEGHTSNNSPLVEPKELQTIKVADVATGGFATISGGVDPRWPIAARLDPPACSAPWRQYRSWLTARCAAPP
jgi:hypothetical protein